MSLYEGPCDPVVLSPGRRVRSCFPIRRVRRLFVGHGTWALKKRIDTAWNQQSWQMWIDGRRVDLSRFGHSDRWLYNYPPAQGRDVVLREWAVILISPRGRHSIRYRMRLPAGVFDTTWKFHVGPM